MVNMWYVFFTSVGLNIFFLFLIALYPGSVNVAINRLLGRGYIFELGKDRKIRIKGGKKDVNSFLTKDGIYEFEFEDIYTFNGQPAGVWFEAYNKAIRPKVMPILAQLKKMGIKTYDDLHFLVKAPLEEVKKVAAKMTNPGTKLVELAEMLRKESWILNAIEYIKVDALLDFLDEKNPITERAVIERKVQQERRKMRNSFGEVMKWVIAAMIIIFGSVIAYKMFIAGGVAHTPVNNPPIQIK